VDVVVCDHVGYFGFDYGVVGLLSDAKKRFLKPGGILVPATLDLHLTPVESADCRKLVAQWRDGSVPADFEWLGGSAANSKHSVELGASDPLAAPTALETLEMGQELLAFMSWSVEFSCERDGTLDGIAGWFDCELAEGTRMTNSPLAANRLGRPQAFLPIDAPFPVNAGDIVKATVMIRHEDGIIGWIVELPESGQRFSHTTFNGLLLDNDTINRARPDRIAKLSVRGRARQIVLSYCDGERTLGEVEALIRREHPDLFPSSQATSSFIKQVLQWDTSE
jgi:protein arginine N-methyltransferase 1